MKKILQNNKGFSLLEVSLAVGVIGINAVAMMHLYSNSAENKQREQIYEKVSNTGKIIQRTLEDNASCEINLKGKSPGDDLPGLKAAIADPNDNTKLITTNESVIQADLGNGLEIEKYSLVSIASRDYLEVQYKLSENKKKLGLSDIKKRYLINTIKGPSGDVIKCAGEVEDQDKLVEAYTCKNNGGTLDSFTGECHLEAKDIKPPKAEECGQGARYKLVYEDGQVITKCSPCTYTKKFISSSCEKKYKGMNWVNVCYYRSSCEEDPSLVFGAQFFSRGPTKARGGDTGTEKNCRKRRLPCEGEKLSATNAKDTALAQAITAEESVQNAQSQVNQILKYYDQGNLEEAHKLFNYLKASADSATQAAYQANQAAQLSSTEEARQAADRAQIAQEKAREYFNQGFVIFKHTK